MTVSVMTPVARGAERRIWVPAQLDVVTANSQPPPYAPGHDGRRGVLRTWRSSHRPGRPKLGRGGAAAGRCPDDTRLLRHRAAAGAIITVVPAEDDPVE